MHLEIKIAAGLVGLATTLFAQAAVIQTGDATFVVDANFQNFVPLEVDPADTVTDIGPDLGFFLNSSSPGGAVLEVNGGSKLAGGRLVTISESDVPGSVVVTGVGSSIDLTRSGPSSPGVLDFASQGSSNLSILDGGAITFQTPEGACPEFQCGAGVIGNAAGTNANVVISGAGSLLDLATDTGQIAVFGQAIHIDDETGFVFGEAGGQTNVNISVQDGGSLETGFAFVARSSEAGANSGTESVNTVVTVTGNDSTWGSDGIAIGFNNDSPTSPDVNGTVIVSNGATIVSDVFVGDGGLLGGNGTVIGTINNFGGTVAPGLSPGVLSIDGDFVMESGSLLIEVAGLETGLFDVLDVTGEIDISGGEIFFEFSDFLPSADDFLQFLVAGSGVSISDDVTFGFGGAAAGFQFAIDAATGSFTAMNDARPVPEPSPMSLIALGVLALIYRRIKPRHGEVYGAEQNRFCRA